MAKREDDKEEFGPSTLLSQNEYADKIHEPDTYGQADREPSSESAESEDVNEDTEYPSDDALDIDPDKADKTDDEDDSIGDEVDAAEPKSVIPDGFAMPAGPGAQPAKDPKLDKYQQFINQYKALQDQRRKGEMMTGLLAAGGKIGQSIAGRASGNFTPDQSGIKMLEQMDNRPVTDFEQAQVVQGRGMSLQDLMNDHDATSSKSKLVRDYLNTRLGMNLGDDVSAADASSLMKSIGKAQSKASRTLPLTNLKTGEKIQGVFHPDTQAMTDLAGNPLGADWTQGYKDVLSTDTKSGEKFRFNTGTGKNMGAITGPGVNAKITPQNPSDLEDDNTAPIVINRSFLNTAQSKALDNSRKAFINEVKDDRNSLNANNRVISVLQAGGQLGDLPREIQDQLNRAFGQKGHISDAQLGGLLGKPDWKNRVQNAVSLGMTGKLTDENRKFLLDVAQLIKGENEKFINAKSKFYSDNLMDDLQSSPNLSKYNIDPKSISNLIGVESAAYPNGAPEPQDPTIAQYAKDHMGGDYDKAKVFLEKFHNYKPGQ